MKAVCSWVKSVALISILNLCLNASYQLTELKPQVCKLCGGTILNSSAVGHFCSLNAGRVDGRCCLSNGNRNDPEHIIGLDLSNCSLTCVQDIQGGSTAFMIDLSLNPIVSINDTAFQGFNKLNYMILPQNIDCPGSNTSWETVEIKDGNRHCEGQRNMCNETGQLSMSCPENSLCAPFGPGFFECSCAENFHGYKCLREGEFPALQVFGPLAASTVVISFFLWATQRRKAKSP